MEAASEADRGVLLVDPLDSASAEAEIPRGRLDALLGRKWIGALLLAAAILLPLLRQRGTPSWQTVWAEDSTIYTHQAVFHGSLRSLFLGYNGYLQLPPRLLALPIPSFSLRYLSIYLAFVAVIAGGLLAWSLYHLTRSWLSSRLLRVALASLVVLMPALGWESTANITNTTWMFLAVLPWALISLEERGRDTVLRSVLAFFGATSSALCLIFIPLALGWLVYRRTRSALIVVVSFFVGVAIQGAVTLSSPPVANGVHSSSILRDTISVHVFGVFLLGTKWESDWWRADWRSLVVVGPLLTVGLLVTLGLGAGRRAQVVAWAFTVIAVILFAVPAWGRGTTYLGLVEGHSDLWVESRFSVAPTMLLASAFAILIAPTGATDRRMVQRIGVLAFAGWTALLLVASFPLSTYRGTDPSWTGRVDRVLTSKCLGRPSSTVVAVPNEVDQAPGYPKLPNGYYPLIVRCSNLE